MINALMLTGSVFMLEVYDRVLPSRSVSTLVALCGMAGILYAAMGLLDVLRHRLLLRAGMAIDQALPHGSSTCSSAFRYDPETASTDCSPCETSTPSDPFCRATGRPLCSTCLLPLYLTVIFAFHPLRG